MKNFKILTILIVLLSFVACNNQDNNSNVTKEVSRADLLIKSGSIGNYAIGTPIEKMEDNLPWRFEEITETISEEGEEFEKSTMLISDSTKKLCEILLTEVDGESAIGEIKIFSTKFETEKGIGVGSAIVEFMHKYSDFNIWYTYVNNTYVIQSKSLQNINFVLDADGVVTEIDPTSDMVTLSPTDFKPETKIIEIRCF